MEDWYKDINLPPDLHPLEPEQRKGTPYNQFTIWFGAQVAVITWTAGTLPIALGMGLKAAIWCIILGNILGSIFFGLVAVMGMKSGLAQMVLGRLPFGRVGSKVPAFINVIMQIGWPGILTYFSVMATVALFAQFHHNLGYGWQIVIALIIYVIQTAIPAYGWKAITVIETYFAPLMCIFALGMTIIVFVRGVNWDFASTLPAGMPQVAIFMSMFAAVGVTWALAWIPNCTDYYRFISPTKHSSWSTFWSGFFGLLSAIWLMCIGCIIAAQYGTGTDPGAMVIKLAPAFAIPGLVIVIHGCIGTNCVSTYSGVMSAMNLGWNWSRAKICWLIYGICPFILTVCCIYLSKIVAVYDNFLLSLIILLSPWTAIICVDFFIVRKDRPINLKALFFPTKDPDDYGSWNKSGILCLVIGYVLGALFANTPMFVGPIAKVLNGMDFSWIVEMIVAGGLYYILESKRVAAQYKQKESNAVTATS